MEPHFCGNQNFCGNQHFDTKQFRFYLRSTCLNPLNPFLEIAQCKHENCSSHTITQNVVRNVQICKISTNRPKLRLRINNNLSESNSFDLNKSNFGLKKDEECYTVAFRYCLSDMAVLPVLVCLPLRCCGMCVNDRHSQNLPKQVHSSLLW